MEDGRCAHSVESKLHERVKELRCLYGIAQLAAKPGASLDEILWGIVRLIPSAWQYPEAACARILVDGLSYESPGFRESAWKQAEDVRIRGVRRGAVEVFYVESKPELDEGPFLQEERALVGALAGQVGIVIERREAERARSELEAQIRHADRLSTLGQLAAGVAHELNEPLGNILGFAELAKRCPDLPPPARADIEKIEAASLHARSIIKKMLLFARQVPTEEVPVDLNALVRESVQLVASRCAQEGIAVHLALDPGLPAIESDPAQLRQILVNLTVNAVQAMPDGGTLTILTACLPREVLLAVEDTGVGMTAEVAEKAFVPFFTTKDVGEGTGLGLPVVHGIVTSLGGSIRFESEAGRGTRFEIRLPAAEAGGPAREVRDGHRT
jgi:two-component system NtrC family sensor kinase